MTVRWRHLLVLAVASCGLLWTGCGGNGSEPAAARSAKIPGSSPRTAGAEATVRRLWTQIGTGSPTFPSEYDPELRDLLGSDLILTVFDSPPPEYSVPPRLTEVQAVSGGVLITVRTKGPGQSEAAVASFLLAQVKGRWLVRYDSNLLNRVRGQVASDAQDRLPRTEAATNQAARAGNRAVLAARRLFAPGPHRSRLPSYQSLPQR